MFYLKQLVGGGSNFPYVVGSEYNSAFGSWCHFEGTSKEDNSAVSIFKLTAGKSDPRLEAARNGVKRLKSVRHPNVLAFKFTLEVEEKGETVIYLVTESVKPLADVLGDLAVTEDARKEYVTMGLYQIAKAVSFLNNECSLIHGGLSMDAVVVTPQLDWRLSGFDLLSEHSGVSSYDSPLRHSARMVSQARKAAEIGKEDWEAVAQAPPWAVDAWGLGCLMQEAYSGQPLQRTENLRNLDDIPKSVAQDYQRLLASAPTRRLNPSKLAESSVLKNKLVDTISFLENLAVKDSAEKDAFFRKLPAAIPSVPLPVAQQKLLPMLAGALEFGGAPAVALAAMLQIGKTLDTESFGKRVVPALSRLFTSTDRSIRRSLLENIDSYGPHLDQATIESQIYPQVATGFSDANAYLRELTLKSMLILAPKLSQKTVNQSLLKHLAKLQVDEEAPIRANTTILLGNLAKHLSESTCKRVLLNAFTRALKDTFPPARTAGLKAMMATADLHAPAEAATRILPAVAPLTIDPVAEVRRTALQALADFSKVLNGNSKLLDDQAAIAGNAAKDGEGQSGSGWTAGLMGGSLGWAISSATAMRASPSESSIAQPPKPVTLPPSSSRDPLEGRDDASSAAGSISAQGWDVEQDLVDQLSNHALSANGGVGVSRAASIDSRTTTSAHDMKGWESEDDWNDDDSHARKPAPRAAPSVPDGAAARPPAPPGAAKRPVLAGRGRGRGARPMKLGAQKLKPKNPDDVAKDYL